VIPATIYYTIWPKEWHPF